MVGGRTNYKELKIANGSRVETSGRPDQIVVCGLQPAVINPDAVGRNITLLVRMTQRLSIHDPSLIRLCSQSVNTATIFLFGHV